MDKPIKGSGRATKNLSYLIVGISVVALAIWYFQQRPEGRSLEVAAERLTISAVVSGVFEDTIPLRGQVYPKSTVFLDAVEGGRVEQVFFEDGAFVEEGDAIIALSNTTLQLDVISREAQVAEQINNLRNTELAIEQSRLQYRRELVDVDYNVRRLGRVLERRRQLHTSEIVSLAALETVEDEFQYYTDLREVITAARDTNALVRATQLGQLRESVSRLATNLQFARSNLDNLFVTAPRQGQLTGLNAEIGQSIQQGERLGQVDNADDFKITAFVDEFYLSRLDNGQSATFTHGGDDYSVLVQRIYPQVSNGQFETDFAFAGHRPTDIRRGQSLQLRLQLGASQTALLLPNGAFYQDTGGTWILLVNSTGTAATRRNVRLGRRNSRNIEILDGLAEGDQVITSSYANYTEVDRVTLSE